MNEGTQLVVIFPNETCQQLESLANRAQQEPMIFLCRMIRDAHEATSVPISRSAALRHEYHPDVQKRCSGKPKLVPFSVADGLSD